MARLRRDLGFPLLALLALAALAPGPVAAASDGTLDPSFDGDGVSGAFESLQPRAAATFPDQSTAVVGVLSFSGGPLVDFLRIHDDATRTTCGAGIFALASFEGRAVLVDRAGNLVVGGVATFTGSTSQDRALIARFPAGACDAFDATWSGSGWELLDDESFCDSEDCLLVDLAESHGPTPKLYALVESRVNFLVSRFFIVAFLANGSLDTAFGSNGYAEVTAPDLGTLAAGAVHLEVDRLGRLLVHGTRFDPDVALDADVFLLTLNSAATPVNLSLADDDLVDELAAELAVGPDGRRLLGVNVPSEQRAWWLAERSDGSWLRTDLDDRELVALAFQGDGRALALVDALDADQLELRRYRVDESLLDPDFGAGGTAVFDSTDTGLGGNGQDCEALVLSGGRPLVACNRHFNNGDGGFFLRLHNRHVFSGGFELGSTVGWTTNP